MNALNIVILAAGKGTRMYSDIPKVLHRLAGKPLVQHVIDCAVSLQPQQICIVYGHGGEAVPQAMQQYGAKFVIQEPQLGTGHAVQQAMPHLQDESRTLILYGDVPLIQHGTLHQMQKAGNGLVLLTVNLDNPAGYGRIVRNSEGDVLRIVEQKDATREELQIQEVNTGIMLAPTEKLREWLGKLSNNNVQGEYYLTDIVAMAVAQGVAVYSVQPAQAWEVEGINNKLQLANLERVWQKEVAARLLVKGVTLIDPARIDVRGELVCGRDVEIDVGCIFEGKVTLGDRVKVGAYSIIRNAAIAQDTQIAPYSHIDDHADRRRQPCRVGRR
jgi:bifunctional UDP-N-acetylglucosamine pyrophosphorylase/glucosamine-1-phosphate N-acetyltransferase